MNPKCLRNPGKDFSGRRNPIYVSRVLSAMVSHNYFISLHVFFCLKIDAYCALLIACDYVMYLYTQISDDYQWHNFKLGIKNLAFYVKCFMFYTAYLCLLGELQWRQRGVAGKVDRWLWRRCEPHVLEGQCGNSAQLGVTSLSACPLWTVLGVRCSGLLK